MQYSKQPSKVQVTLPDYVTIGQYNQFKTVKMDKPLNFKLWVISLVTGMSLDEVKGLSPTIYGPLFLDCVDMFSVVAKPGFAFEYKDKCFAFNKTENRTIGEFADLESVLSDKDFHNILTVLICEVDKPDVEFDKIDDNFSVAYITDFDKNVKSYGYPIYNSDNTHDADFFLDFPLPAYLALLDFTLGIGISSWLASGPNFRSNHKDKLARGIEKFHLASVGIRQLCNLQRIQEYSTSEEEMQSLTLTLASA